MNREIKEAIFCIYLYYFSGKIRFDFKKDNLKSILKPEIDKINSIYIEYFSIELDKNNEIKVYIKNFEKIKELDSDIFYSMDLFSVGNNYYEIKKYISRNFTNQYSIELSNFFDYIYDLIPKSQDIINYAGLFDNFSIKNLILFYYYGIGSDNLENIKKSIYYLELLIDSFPDFVSFYLFRTRQKFNLFYRVIIGKSKFNKLITSESGRKLLLEHEIIKNCFSDFDKAESLLENYSITYLYRGKFLLHFLDEGGIELLKKAISLDGRIYDFEVYAWIGVYYLQIGDYLNSEFFIKKSLDNPEDPAKYYGKLIYLYILSGNIVSIIDFIEKQEIKLIIYHSGKYYILNSSGNFEENYFKDEFDLKYRMGFSISNIDKILGGKYNSNIVFIEENYKYISKNYFDHWNSDENDKLIFYSLNNFGGN